ncbi:sulfatase-like hydrolase/transferase, partial [bacterium]|nr:sulfatase-like hydrolase/transferase [bacterium]
MNRRTFLKNSALAGSALYTPYPFDEPKEVSEEYSLQRLYNQEWMKPSPEHPNIILITTDHMRVDNIAANGNEAMQTPHLDGMAKNGASFLRCHCPSPVCMPSRASLFTGRYPSNHDVRRNGVPLSEDEITITHILANEGYYTGQIGKLHFLPHYDRNHRGYHPPYGFDEMRLSDEPGCYDDAYGRWLEALGPKAREQGRVRMPGKKEARKWKTCYPFEGPDNITHAWWVGEETINFIKRNKNRPFFMHTGFYAPHPPLNPPQSQLDRYNGVKLPRRLYRKNEGNTMPKSYRNTFIRNSRHSEGYWEEYKKYFYAMVSNVDVQMGRILETLKNEKILDNTLIIFTSDHGDYLGDHNHVSKGAPVYKGMMEV